MPTDVFQHSVSGAASRSNPIKHLFELQLAVLRVHYAQLLNQLLKSISASAVPLSLSSCPHVPAVCVHITVRCSYSFPAFCHTRESLHSLCSLITGDALLYSMFRVDATPVECPFKGPLSFTYNRGHGECRSPVSSIDSCTEESRLLLRYQACPDVHGTESTGKEAVEQIP